jgi:hypothetical protein
LTCIPGQTRMVPAELLILGVQSSYFIPELYILLLKLVHLTLIGSIVAVGSVSRHEKMLLTGEAPQLSKVSDALYPGFRRVDSRAPA